MGERGRKRKKEREREREKDREREKRRVVRTCGPPPPRSILLVSKSRYERSTGTLPAPTNSRVRLTAIVVYGTQKIFSQGNTLFFSFFFFFFYDGTFVLSSDAGLFFFSFSFRTTTYFLA